MYETDERGTNSEIAQPLDAVPPAYDPLHPRTQEQVDRVIAKYRLEHP